MMALARIFKGGIPQAASAPFSPGEVSGTITVQDHLPWWRKLLVFAGPGMLVSVGYMDPGNWATDIESGSRYGYGMLWVVALASLMAMLLQVLAMKLGVVTRQDLAHYCRARYPRGTRLAQWLLAELAIVATDMAEVLGTALALNLLFGVSLPVGIVLTVLDMLLVLGFKGRGVRQLEAIMLGLVSIIAICFLIELLLAAPVVGAVLAGFIPQREAVTQPEFWYLAVGVIGATVMPHNLYLHSSVVQTRMIADTENAKRAAVSFFKLDTVVSLTLALLVNAAILILAGAVFHVSGHTQVAQIDDAYHLLDPLVGTSLAAVLFGIALLASGQSSTFTGTIAAQVVMDGFLDIRLPCWQRRLITRCIAIVPALAGILWLGDGAIGKLLIGSQVVLALQLPFALWPLITATNSRRVMGPFANSPITKLAAWLIFGAIVAANIWMMAGLFP